MSEKETNDLQIHFKREKFVARDEPVDIFHSFFELQGEMYSVHRRFGLVSRFEQNLDKNFSHLILTRYDIEDGEFIPRDEKILRSTGTDPRVISNGETAYILSYLVESFQPLRLAVRVLQLPSEEEVSFYELPDRPLGKNWQPFIRDTQLHILHAFDPATVYRLSMDGSMDCISDQHLDSTITAQYDSYSQHRGGTNGLVGDDGNVYGFGHITETNYSHLPFTWKITKNGEVSRGEAIEFSELKKQGWNIRDVTSCFIQDGRLYLGLALSERDWFHAQRFASLLVSIPCEDASNIYDSKEKWEASNAYEGLFKTVKTIFPSDLESEILCTDVLGTRLCADGIGFIAFEKKPLNIPYNLPLCFQVTYSSHLPEEHLAGFIRIPQLKGALPAMPSFFYRLPGTAGREEVAQFTLEPEGSVDTYQLFIATRGSHMRLDNIRVMEAKNV